MMKDAGLRPNTYCMNSLMAVNVQARQPNTALEIFKEMERDGITRDVVSEEFLLIVSAVSHPSLQHVLLLRRETDLAWVYSFTTLRNLCRNS